MIFIRTIFFLFILIAAKNVVAQDATTISASVDKSTILIGEPLQLTVEVQIPDKNAIRFITIDSIDHFEFLEKPRFDTVNTGSGTLLKGVYKITSFDSGHWVIPAFIFSGSIKTDTIPVDVVFSTFNPEQDYHDIKSIIEVKPAKKKEWWWYAAGGGLLVLLFVLYLLLKRKPKPIPVIPTAIINPYEEAMKSLQELAKSNTGVKQYHTRLGDIFRLYLFRKKGILSLQKTTDDIVLQLKEMNMSKELFNRLAQALRLSDFVKFAKYIPATEDDRFAFESIQKSIDEIESIR
ncbi:MAG: hypothetical protein WBC06_16015 [Chitinophagaceae bacterium]